MRRPPEALPPAVLRTSLAAALVFFYVGPLYAGAGPAAVGAAPPGACTPLETRPPNAPDQRPAFEAQTRACATKTQTPFQVVVLAKDLQKPWAVEPLPSGDFLVTEKAGNLRLVSATGAVGAPIAGVPEVDSGGQGGLLDVALSPTFTRDRTLYVSFTEPRAEGNGTSVARAVWSADGQRLEQVKIVFRALPTYDNGMHFGSRLAFDADGMLFVTTGDRSDTPMRKYAQDLGSHLGKVLRIKPQGGAPMNNPFIDQGAPEAWTLGHRNIQAAAVDARGRLWIVEHGPKGGDELNLIHKGRNYGWPRVSFGEEYSGAPIPDAATARPGYEPPVYYWDPVIAPSGAQFYTGMLFPEWRNNLFVGALKERRLVRLVLKNDKVVGEEHLLTDRGERIRDVRQGPDGALYVVTDSDNGELWKIVPRQLPSRRAKDGRT